MTVTGNPLQPTLFELSRPGRGAGTRLPAPPADALARLPASARRVVPPALPELNEATLVRHYVNLSHLNWSVDTGFYPLGSCTMKYNPKVNEWAARLPGFAALHPLAPDETAQGTLELLWRLEQDLAEISGMDAVTLQPAAGAQGELTGILMIRAYHRARGDAARTDVLVPDSAHGTNPATASMAGFRTVNIPSAADGGVDLDAFRAALGPTTAAVMITNPSTLGLFETRVVELLEMVHAAGALAYMDGANLNAMLGHFRPGAAGFDVMHFNVHKTFSTPHGGGGPGAGPVGVRSQPRPVPPGAARPARARRQPSASSGPGSGPRASAGCARSSGTSGSWSAPTRTSGPTAATACARSATTRSSPRTTSSTAWRRPTSSRSSAPACTSSWPRRAPSRRRPGCGPSTWPSVSSTRGSTRPTIYFPLTVDEGMLIEPTETESLETLDAFVDAMLEIAREASESPELVKSAPHTAPVRRLDEATAARQPNLRWRAEPAG